MVPTDNAFSIEPIGVLRSPFGEKFGTPRQAGLVDEAIAEIELFAPFGAPETLDGLAGFSHLWLMFIFDRSLGQGWRPRVRPPRLGGNREVGVWASRAPFRPNPLGLSVVRLVEVLTGPVTRLKVAGVDMTDGTPIVDIKPYVPYADSIPGARGGFAEAPPPAALQVRFAPDLRDWLGERDPDGSLRDLIVAVVALDPRPAYRRGAEPGRVYGSRLAGHDVRWRVGEDVAEVVAIEPCSPAVTRSSGPG